MTNKEKIDLLKKIKADLETSSIPYFRGICGAYKFITGLKPTEEHLVEIGIYKPKDKEMDVYWFTPKEREVVINTAIAHFEALEQPTLETLEAQKAEIEKRIAEMKSDKIDLGKFYEDKKTWDIELSLTPPNYVCIKTGNTFTGRHYPSKHTAEKALLMIKLIQIAYILNGGDWSAGNAQAGFVLCLNKNTQSCEIAKTYYNAYGIPEFKTRELAERAMKQFTADELKKLLS